MSDYTKYFDALHLSWKFFLGLLFLLIWPLASAAFYLYSPNLFLTLDIFRLCLLTASFIVPPLVINGILFFFVLKPFNRKIREIRPVSYAESAASLFSLSVIFMLLLAFVMGNLFNVKASTMLMAVGGIQAFVILFLLVIIIRERDDSATEVSEESPRNGDISGV